MSTTRTTQEADLRRVFDDPLRPMRRGPRRQVPDALLLEIVDRVSGGETMTSVAADLTRRGVPAPGRQGTSWACLHVSRLLRSVDGLAALEAVGGR